MQKIFHKKPKLDYYKYLNYLLTNELPILSKSDLYVPVLSHLSSKAYINFPDEFSYKEIGLLNEHIVTVLQNRGVSHFLHKRK